MTLQPSDSGVKRPYRSPRREAQARETKKAILEAATRLFTERGFQETTIKQVADLAAVSEQTVYNVFEDKVGLLYEVGLFTIQDSDGDELLGAVDRLTAEPDPLRRIRAAARISREQWQHGALEVDTMLSNTAIKDPRLVDLASKSLNYKLEVNRAFCRALFPDSIRSPDITQEEIAAYVTAVDSGPTITTLLRLGWTMDDYEDWFTRLLTRFLDPHIVS